MILGANKKIIPKKNGSCEPPSTSKKTLCSSFNHPGKRVGKSRHSSCYRWNHLALDPVINDVIGPRSKVIIRVTHLFSAICRDILRTLMPWSVKKLTSVLTGLQFHSISYLHLHWTSFKLPSFEGKYTPIEWTGFIHWNYLLKICPVTFFKRITRQPNTYWVGVWPPKYLLRLGL